MLQSPDVPDSLDPEDWVAFRQRAHAMLERALDRMEGAREGRVWTPPPADLLARFAEMGQGAAAVDEALAALLPYGTGNTHPRFFGWVHGSGTPSNLIAELVASAMNANCGGRNHAAIHIERQVVDWARQIFGFPETAGGLVVSGTSMATLIALKTAREARLGVAAREKGVSGTRLAAYASAEAHACNARAFDMLGLGARTLRKIPVDGDFRMDLAALQVAIAEDRAAGLEPFALIGTAGTVNTGATDDLSALADIAAREQLWMHVDGAFGACAMLSPELAPRLAGIERADSLAFDFHKWLHVNYDAGCVLIRDRALQAEAFAGNADYLRPAARGLAAGAPWPTDLGPELSRGFRALKVWAQLAEYGPERLGHHIARNCSLAAELAARVDGEPALERLAPTALNICCLRYAPGGLDASRLDALNEEITIALQESGVAAPSTTMISGKRAIRVNLTNHRTQSSDIHLLVDEILRLGAALT